MSFIPPVKRTQNRVNVIENNLTRKAEIDPDNRMPRQALPMSQWYSANLGAQTAVEVNTQYNDLGTADGTSPVVFNVIGPSKHIQRLTLANASPLQFSITSEGLAANRITELCIILIQDATGNRELSVPSASVFRHGSLLNEKLDSAANSQTMFRFVTVDAGQTWDVELVGLDAGVGSSMLEGLTDVEFGTIADSNVLAYDDSTSRWTNRSLTQLMTMNGEYGDSDVEAFLESLGVSAWNAFDNFGDAISQALFGGAATVSQGIIDALFGRKPNGTSRTFIEGLFGDGVDNISEGILGILFGDGTDNLEEALLDLIFGDGTTSITDGILEALFGDGVDSFLEGIFGDGVNSVTEGVLQALFGPGTTSLTQGLLTAIFGAGTTSLTQGILRAIFGRNVDSLLEGIFGDGVTSISQGVLVALFGAGTTSLSQGILEALFGDGTTSLSQGILEALFGDGTTSLSQGILEALFGDGTTSLSAGILQAIFGEETDSLLEGIFGDGITSVSQGLLTTMFGAGTTSFAQGILRSVFGVDSDGDVYSVTDGILVALFGTGADGDPLTLIEGIFGEGTTSLSDGIENILEGLGDAVWGGITHLGTLITNAITNAWDMFWDDLGISGNAPSDLANIIQGVADYFTNLITGGGGGGDSTTLALRDLSNLNNTNLNAPLTFNATNTNTGPNERNAIGADRDSLYFKTPSFSFSSWHFQAGESTNIMQLSNRSIRLFPYSGGREPQSNGEIVASDSTIKVRVNGVVKDLADIGTGSGGGTPTDPTDPVDPDPTDPGTVPPGFTQLTDDQRAAGATWIPMVSVPTTNPLPTPDQLDGWFGSAVGSIGVVHPANVGSSSGPQIYLFTRMPEDWIYTTFQGPQFSTISNTGRRTSSLTYPERSVLVSSSTNRTPSSSSIMAILPNPSAGDFGAHYESDDIDDGAWWFYDANDNLLTQRRDGFLNATSASGTAAPTIPKLPVLTVNNPPNPAALEAVFGVDDGAIGISLINRLSIKIAGYWYYVNF